MLPEFLRLSLTPMLIAVLACVACALPGNFLILRRQSLIGDAVSHVVLPGLVGAFVLTGRLDTGPMLLGATIAALFSIALIDLIRRFGKVEPGAAMGVVFTSLFAAGVVALEQTHASNVHLDVEHVLYGNLESLIWLDATGWSSLFDPQALAGLPPQLPRLAIVLLIVALFLLLRWKALVISTFDPNFADSIGAYPSSTGLLLMIIVALSAVVSFEAVGAIIVVAMFICPAATARLLSNKLPIQMLLSMFFACSAAILGYIVAAWGPGWLGGQHSVSAAGMIALMCGLQLMLACCFGPYRKPLYQFSG